MSKSPDVNALLAKALTSDPASKRLAKAVIIARSTSGGRSISDIIDEMAEAIRKADCKEEFALLTSKADAGDVPAQAELAHYRRLARAAHTAFLKALDPVT